MEAKPRKAWVKAPIGLLEDTRLGGDHIRLLLFLIGYCNPIRDLDYHCWPSNAELAKRMGCKGRWISKLLRQLAGEEPIRNVKHGHHWIKRYHDVTFPEHMRKIRLCLDGYEGFDTAEEARSAMEKRKGMHR